MRPFLGTVPEVLLRVAVAFAYLFPPVDAWFDPNSWIGYLPAFVNSWRIDPHLILHGFGLVEIALAFWLLTGWKARVPALLMGALLLVSVSFNAAQFAILFRDVSIALAAFALAFWPSRAH